MNWRRVDDYCVLSDPPGYAINRSGHARHTFTAVALGTPRGEGWEGSVILHVERDIDAKDEDARRRAFKRCAEACRSHAARGVVLES